MEKERKIKTLSLVALIVAVLGLTVAFAALSQTLTINGTASVNSAEWDIHFENLSEPTITGDAREEGKALINGKRIEGYDIYLSKPGDKVEYTFDIVNAGTIDAGYYFYYPLTYIESIVYHAATSVEGDYLDLNKDGILSYKDSDLFRDLIDFRLYDENNVELYDSDGHVLKSKQVQHVKLVIEYKENATMVFEKPIKVFADGENGYFSFEFIQE